MPDPIRIPLYGRTGTIRAYALVSREDAHLAEHRWCLLSNGYVKRQVGPRGGQRTLLLHREVMGLVSGDPRECDHIDRDRLNNCRENLRIATRQQNVQNMPSKGVYSQYRGVTWDKTRNKWAAKVQLNHRCFNLGRYETEAEAAAAAFAFRKAHMPFSMD